MNVLPQNSFQLWFFDRLASRFEKRGDMVQELAKTLNIGRDAIYRRLRGDTILSADELIFLARKYYISLDENVNETPQLIYPSAIQEINSELDYYQEFEQQCLMLTSITDVSIDHATPELPIYYDLFTPTLFAFKTYVYGLTTWNLKKWKKLPFKPDLIHPEVFEIAERLLDPIFKLPGRELWSVGILDITLRQVEHAVEVGRLNDLSLAKKMFNEIEMTISHMEEMTRCGKRFVPGRQPQESDPDFRVYHNEMTNTNNVIIIKSSHYSAVFSTFINPNFIISTDERIQAKMETWFENLVENSSPLDASSGKYNEKFFVRLRRIVAASWQRIDVALSLHM